jgi:putative transcriptional regulator
MRTELVEARKKRKFTQASFSKELGISRSFYGLIETGYRNPDYGLAVKISKMLKTKPSSIFFDLNGFRMKQMSKTTA